MKKYIAIIAMGCIAAFATSCEKEGPAEKAGKKVDNAAEETKDKLEEVGDNVEDATDK